MYINIDCKTDGKMFVQLVDVVVYRSAVPLRDETRQYVLLSSVGILSPLPDTFTLTTRREPNVLIGGRREQNSWKLEKAAASCPCCSVCVSSHSYQLERTVMICNRHRPTSSLLLIMMFTTTVLVRPQSSSSSARKKMTCETNRQTDRQIDSWASYCGFEKRSMIVS